jgi:23S rRNA pseudouridine2604 synthase
MTEPIRLAKRVAELVPCSRSKAERYIEGGWVSVDGAVVEEPAFRVTPQQTVTLAPDAVAEDAVPVTILWHKPAGIDVMGAAPAQLIDPGQRAADDRSGLRFLKRHLTGLKPTDALDPPASGLVALTQDWRIARKLIDDAATVEHELIVEVAGALAPNGLALLSHGLRWNGKPLPPIKVSWQNETRLRFALKTPPRGLIEHMCRQVGLSVVAMKRLRIGRIPLAGLEPGQWRYLLGYERF